jgi:hypothetical protein
VEELDSFPSVRKRSRYAAGTLAELSAVHSLLAVFAALRKHSLHIDVVPNSKQKHSITNPILPIACPHYPIRSCLFALALSQHHQSRHKRRNADGNVNPLHPLQYAIEFMVGHTDIWKAAKRPTDKHRRIAMHLSLNSVLSSVEADPSLPEMEQPAGLKGVKLHRYQRCATTALDLCVQS